jgi:hypothetical protein
MNIQIQIMKQFSIFLILSFLILVSCTTTKPLTSNVNPKEVTDLKLLEPYSYISKISKGNRQQLDDSISTASKRHIIKVLENLNGQIPLTGKIILSDTSINKTLEKEFESLILTADRTKNISNLKITPTIDKVLEANGVRFGLITVGSGFTRIKGNYGKQVAKGAAMAILTLGMYYQTPVKAYSTIYVMIVDSKEDNISFFRKSYLQDKEPLDENVLTKQYKDIFKGYFLPTK